MNISTPERHEYKTHRPEVNHPSLIRRALAAISMSTLAVTASCIPPDVPPTTSTEVTTTTESTTTTSTTTTEAPDPWIPGGASTLDWPYKLLEGKYVYQEDIEPAQWQTSYDSCSSTPQCELGLDPERPNNNGLVSPQEFPDVDFSEFPAQDACKSIGGRLPTVDEGFEIYYNQSAYGNNYAGPHWTSREQDGNNAWYLNNNIATGNGGFTPGNKLETLAVRCVKD